MPVALTSRLVCALLVACTFFFLSSRIIIFHPTAQNFSEMLEFVSCMNLEPLFFQITWNISFQEVLTYFHTTYYKQVVFT